MSDEIVLNGQTYVSSKRAAEATGYARDYIGQLSRGGHIAAERVGGLWYVSMESLQNYEKNAEIAKATAPAIASSKEAESMLSFEGKDYISASRASKLTGYNQDYVGQLARGGKIPSRQIGNRWYVDKDALVAHKREKDALLAAVQADSVGLRISPTGTHNQFITAHAPEPISYSPEHTDLLPKIEPKNNELPTHVVDLSNVTPKRVESEPAAVQTQSFEPQVSPIRPPIVPMPRKKTKNKRSIALSGAALTIILVAAVGITVFKGPTTFAVGGSNVLVQSMSASAAGTVTKIGDVIEDIVSPELVYQRGQ